MFVRCYLKSFVISLTLCYLAAICICQDCTPYKSCSCSFPNGSVIDLSSLGFQNGTPRFLNVPSNLSGDTSYTFSYNPCYSFTEGGCAGVAVCQIKSSDEQYFNAGIQSSAQFFVNNSQLAVNYTGMERDLKRTTTVNLVCDTTRDELVVNEESPPTFYKLTLYSKCACLDGCLGAPNPDDNLSTGSVLVILLFVFIMCYILGGIVFQKIMKGATGRELLPNYEFWMDFPLLVRDGVIFTCNGCQNEVSYERI